MEAVFRMPPPPRARSRGAIVLMPSQTPFTLPRASGRRSTARLLDRGERLAESVGRAVDEPEARALRREAHRGGAPDATGGAGDQHHLALESPGRRIGHPIAATAMIPPGSFGAASRASPV